VVGEAGSYDDARKPGKSLPSAGSSFQTLVASSQGGAPLPGARFAATHPR
jgi:hypothetical protein